MLDKQINLFKVDTNAFLFEEELKDKYNVDVLKRARHKMYKKLNSRTGKYKDMYNALIEKRDGVKDEDGKIIKQPKELSQVEKCFITVSNEIKKEEKEWKPKLLKSAADNVVYNNTHKNKKIRKLNENYISYVDKKTKERKVNLSNVVAMFESTLSRSFEIQTDELTYDIFIVEIYYYDIAQDLIINGFDYNGQHYVYFSSSAGQIRTKKAVFVNEEKFNKCRNKLMCGLSPEIINSKGGMNINKYLAYTALANSATDLWFDVFGKDFDIDRTIVVDDFETDVKCKVDNISYETYEITEGVEMEIPIPHTDGCGMILPEYSKKNFMVRLPFIKGLLGSFDYKKFITVNNCSSKIKDIWGKEYDIFEDDIQIIFTKSQLKMYKFYDSWEQYKDNFRKYNCEACVCNMEEDVISNAHINYQMLQSLYLATNEDIKDMCEWSNTKIKNVSNSVRNALQFFGVYLDNYERGNKDYFQKSLKIYPELLNDPANKNDLHDLKNSYVNNARGGKLDVAGKFTFVLPDLYAFCDWLFNGTEKPVGLLDVNEVYCKLYKNCNELDCLRSPHLYIEHAIRNNVCNKEGLSEWFNTDAIYTSTHDAISRILQFDVDGDRLLVLAQKKLVDLAKRCTVGVNPLYYEMHKADSKIITSAELYEGLRLAFTGGRIGGISNDVTKIWNSGKDITEDAKKAMRWLCMETNFTIDYAKTLFKPTRPEDVDNLIKSFTKAKVPYFFRYAKGKKYNKEYKKSQVEKINDSMMNRIVKEIKENRNMFKPLKGLSDLDYKVLLPADFEEYTNDDVNECFNKWNKKYGNNIKFDEDNQDKNNISVVAQCVVKELLDIEPDINKVYISLVTFLYKKPTNRKKKLLWYIFGEQLYNNICSNVTSVDFCYGCGKRTDKLNQDNMCITCRGMKEVECIDCHKPVLIKAKDRKTCRCSDCQHEVDIVNTRERVRRFRQN